MAIIRLLAIRTNCDYKIMVRVRPVLKKGELPVLAETLTSFHVGVTFPLVTIINLISMLMIFASIHPLVLQMTPPMFQRRPISEAMRELFHLQTLHLQANPQYLNHSR